MSEDDTDDHHGVARSTAQNKTRARKSNATTHSVIDLVGLGRIYTGQDSPFIVENGTLLAFRPSNAIQFLQNHEIDARAKGILLDGFRAWVICPTAILKTAHRSLSVAESNKFVHDAMLISAARWLAKVLDIARDAQIKQNDSDPDILLGNLWMTRFPYEIFFALGGLKSVLAATSMVEFDKNVANQWGPAVSVIAMMEVLRERACRENANPGLSRWGKNNAATKALALRKLLDDDATMAVTARKLLHDKAYDQRKPLEAAAIRKYWANLEPSAPYLYGAYLVDNGQLFRSLFLPDDDYVSGDEEWFAKWLGYTAEIAETILIPRKMAPNWDSCKPPNTQPMPLPPLVHRPPAPASVAE